jgi:tRNA G10  N-methylase Trm11
MQAFTVLGSNPQLSIAELKTLIKKAPSLFTNEVAIFDDVDTKLDVLQQKLGGIQKIGSVIGSVTTINKKEITDFLASMLQSQSMDGKIYFGFSIYDIENAQRTQKLQMQIKAIGLEIKSKLKYAGRSARFVTSKENTLSSVIVSKNHLLDRGAEFVFLVKDREILIGQTQAVQDFKDWSHRDYDRPARDARRGMLPPKLARMMVNLTGINLLNTTLLDPFCGSGTILMEGALLGAEKLIGSDISEKAVEDTIQNLEWLRDENYNVPIFEVLQSKASNLAAYHAKESIGAVATEPFLGNPRSGRETINQIKQAIEDLEQLYFESFSAIYPLMKKGAPIVIASPIHIRQGEQFPVRTKKILKKIGFIEDPISKEPVIYKREGQFVAREIMRFTS